MLSARWYNEYPIIMDIVAYRAYGVSFLFAGNGFCGGERRYPGSE